MQISQDLGITYARVQPLNGSAARGSLHDYSLEYLMSTVDRHPSKGRGTAVAGRVRARLGGAVLVGVSLVVWMSAASHGQDDPGKREYVRAGCDSCHGPEAKGTGQAPELAGITRPFPEFLKIVREGTGEMPPHTRDEVSDEQLTSIYKWLTQLSSTGAGRAGA